MITTRPDRGNADAEDAEIRGEEEPKPSLHAFCRRADALEGRKAQGPQATV